MLRKFTLAIACLLLCTKLFATHITGAEIYYQYNGTNYTVTVNMYRDCAGIAGAPTITLSFVASSCSINFTRTFNLTSVDSNAGMYCPGAGAYCGGTSLLPMRQIYTYRDTVTLDSCTDWKISTTNTALNSGVVNIASPANTPLYVEAFLNNSSAINSNAVIINKPPFVMGVNDFHTTTVQAIDPNDDSLVYQMIAPQSAASTNMTYTTPYSSTNPLNGFASIDQGLQYLELETYNVGNYELSIRVNEYRNSVLIGYSTRTWMVTALTGTATKVPLPATGSTFEYITHPGQTQTITMNFIDSMGTDSVFVGFTPTNSWTYTTTSSPALGSGSGDITWTTPTSVNPATTPYFYIYVPVHDNSCNAPGRASYTILVKVIQPSPNDSVWAGDADDDYAVTMYDPLAIAIAYGQTGATRTGASTSWIPQYCAPWAASFLSTINMKHADCNGDGTVNSTDLAAVSANYGMSHPKGGRANAKTTGFPDLYFDLTGIVFSPGANVSIPIKFGDAVTPVSNIYGLAASVEINGAVTLGAAPTITYASSWIGTTSNTLNFAKNISNNRVDWAYARTDQSNVSGNGTIATLNFTVPATATVGQQMIFHFNTPRLIDKMGNILSNYNAIDSSALVSSPSIINNAENLLQYAEVVPNPSTTHTELHLFLNGASTLQISITDMLGKTIWQKSTNANAGIQSIILPTSSIAPGMYLIHIQGEGWQYKQNLKWIKE